MKSFRKIVTVLEDRQANWDNFLEAKKQLELNGFGMWTSDSDKRTYGYKKQYSVHDSTPTEYTAGIYFGLTPDYEIVNVVVITSYEYYSGTEHSTGPRNTQRTIVDSIDAAIEYVKQHYQQELDRHKYVILTLMNASLEKGHVLHYLNSVRSLQGVGITWKEVNQNTVKQKLEQNKDNIIRSLLVRYKSLPGDPNIKKTIDMLRDKVDVTWPELAAIEKSQKTLPRS
jgi:hypothetical protein